MPFKQNIFIVEDERPIARVLQVYLQQAGYEVELAADGEAALEAFAQNRYDLVLLDLMLPGIDGWTVLEEIRKQSSCPVIMLTASGAVKDRIKGFKQGADDYIPKPFDPEEVLARIQAVLRRPARIVEPDQVHFGSLLVDFSVRSAFVAGQTVTLAPRDFDLLAFFVGNPNQSFTRSQLLDRVWGLDYEGGDRAVDVAVKRLRQALKDWPNEEGEIVTVRGMGYLLRV
jgi:DNA-binding response OmpR family regulator